MYIMYIKYIIFLLFIFLIFLNFYNKKEHFYSSDLFNNSDYKKRILINKKPNFKLKAYCINLKYKSDNRKFIETEWKDFLDISFFEALKSATNSHVFILNEIWKNKNKIEFPIVIMEDDVFRKNNFTDYFNEIKNIKNCDYIAFDCFFLELKKNQKNINKKFVSLLSNRSMGMNVYYKYFFDRFNSLEELNKGINSNKTIDMNFTNDPKFIKLTPNKQVCRQIVNKNSTTSKKKKNTNNYNNYYEKAENFLKFL
jgi:hypothetical protein